MRWKRTSLLHNPSANSRTHTMKDDTAGFKRAKHFISNLQQCIEDNVDAAESIHVFLEEFPELDTKMRSMVNDVFVMLAGKTVEEILRDADPEAEAHDEALWEDVEGEW